MRPTPAFCQAVFNLRVARVRSALAAPGELAELDATLAALARGGAHDAWLAARTGLSAQAIDFLWTVVALEVEPRILPRAIALAGPEVRRGATLGLHVQAFGLDEAAGQRLAGELDIHRGAGSARILLPALEGEVLPAVPFIVPRRVRSFLAGRDDVDPLVTRFGGVHADPGAAVLDAGQRRADEVLQRALDEDGDHLVLVEGPAGVGRARAVARAAAELGRACVELDLARWDGRLASLDDVLAAWWRECLLRDAVGLLAHIDAAGDDREGRRVASAIDAIPGVIAATARGRGCDLGLRRPVVRVAYPLPGRDARRELWRRAAGDGADVDLDLLAGRYRMGAGGIERAAHAARLTSEEPELTTAALIGGVRSSVAERLGDLATRIPVSQSWDDLVLPEDVLAQIQGLIARVRHAHLVYDLWGFGRGVERGQGVAALLSGPPGTGKTMVAGLVAQKLQLDLFQVDLSRVVSKWIGETEKQLAAVFDAAEAGHALLLFDEADALFAKRTADVKGATDRYANLEVNYLLQRIEAFGGITILTTNLETAMDPAVKRRLAASIVFPHPEEHEREVLWRRMLPQRVPLAGEIDFHGLAAAFPRLTGAHIRNAAVSASFQAAATAAPLSQALLHKAASAEYQAMDRVMSDSRGGV